MFPLDNGALERLLTPRPSAVAGRDTFTYSGELVGLDPGSAPSILNKSYTITAEVEIPQSGGEGMIVTNGGRFGGYGTSLERKTRRATNVAVRMAISGQLSPPEGCL